MKLLCLFSVLLISTLVNAEIISRNIVIPSSYLKVVDAYSDESQIGSMTIKTCLTCDELLLTLDKNTRVILADADFSADRLTSLSLTSVSTSVRIQYNKDDLTVSYISWYSINEG